MIDAVFNTQTEDMRTLADRVLYPLIALGGNEYCLTRLVLSASFAEIVSCCSV